jgi:fructuronate reductase
MKQLSCANLSELSNGVKATAYDRDSVSAGIVHFGVGNFHRAHQAVYCDALLSQGETKWGIIGVSLRSPTIRDKLSPQNFLYTQATLHSTSTDSVTESDTSDYQVIGAIQNILVAPENPQTVINAVANCRTQLVTTTITEKGYCLANGDIDQHHGDIAADLESIDRPQTSYGYIAAAVIKRCVDNAPPLTILCCDNIQAGGDHLQNGVQMLLQRHSPETLVWLAHNVAFCASIVDRVTPVTTDALKQAVTEKVGLVDAAPVAAEPFTQWIIEDHFVGDRPPFDRVGALFVDDIVPFEKVKLRFLNAGHSMLAAMGYLAGDVFIHDALQRPALADYTEKVLKLNVLPVTSVPDSVDGEDYIDQVLERFRNANLPYAVLQVGSDSSQKIQQRWLPSIDDSLTQKRDAPRLAFALASWVSFILKALANDDLNDPMANAFAKYELAGAPSYVKGFLAIAGAERFACFNDDSFMADVEKFHLAIESDGIEQALLTTN